MPFPTLPRHVVTSTSVPLIQLEQYGAGPVQSLVQRGSGPVVEEVVSDLGSDRVVSEYRVAQEAEPRFRARMLTTGELVYEHGTGAAPPSEVARFMAPLLSVKNLEVVPSSPSEPGFRTRSAQSTAPLGPELVTNGTFDNDLSGWTIGGSGTGWSWNNGVAQHDGSGTNTDPLSQDIEVTPGKTYQIEFTITGLTNIGWSYITIDIGGVFIESSPGNNSFDNNGTYRRTFVAGGTSNVQTLTITPDAYFDGAVDNISVREVTDNARPSSSQVDDTGTGFMEVYGSANQENLFIGLMSGSRNASGSWNTSLGFHSMSSSIVGDHNTAVGSRALYSLTDGSRNVAIGSHALYSNRLGRYNIAIGSAALYSANADNNIAIGAFALYNNVSAPNNIAIGTGALYSLTSGSNIAIGDYILYTASVAVNNIAIGSGNLLSSDNVQNNVAIGFGAMGNNTGGNDNGVIGNNALANSAIGHENVALGSLVMFNNYSGSQNIAIGTSSLYSNYDGNYNIAIGHNAFYSNTSGSENVAIGVYAGNSTADGSSNSTSSRCLYIGANTRSSADGVTNENVLGYGAIGVGSDTFAYGNDSIVKHVFRSGDVGIAVTNPLDRLHQQAPYADDVNTLQSTAHRLTAQWYDGAASRTRDAVIRHLMVSTVPESRVVLEIEGVTLISFLDDQSMLLPLLSAAPAAEDGKVYFRTTDSNNNDLYATVLTAGAVTEVALTSPRALLFGEVWRSPDPLFDLDSDRMFVGAYINVDGELVHVTREYALRDHDWYASVEERLRAVEEAVDILRSSLGDGRLRQLVLDILRENGGA